ncbi:DnaA N-terminal domain-containing protein [Cognatiyoonia sp. IB215182]|uniref:DnaA N-terminal domain-containing protein n=1 Tax=Cognatiyoonia sp. IB215182 TaxID=3097353 RepID=UPI002A0EFBAB|nr:DnaA N-terminal domain-containing protein [Cognatiyoonia sp. IB215182]MDX8354831.1 DnaA N-terminal domain-containing protein [Cognatiyoonia sp. IB215182]
MEVKRLTGVKASSMKYDILTALSVAGLHLGVRHQISIARLVLLITARYNWRQDEFCVGQRDLARMWNVTERTVKREIKFWQDQQWLICKRQGVRGRVGAYRLNYPEIYQMSEPYWSRVGSDFNERMAATHPVKTTTIVSVDFRKDDKRTQASSVLPDGPEKWRAACQRMRNLHPAHYQNWIAGLAFQSDEEGTLTLASANRFVAHYVQNHLMPLLTEAVEACLGPRRRIIIEVCR